MRSRTEHVRSLDGLRGLAVLAVMASHLFPGNTHGILRPVGLILQFGATGVDLFFVLSGFLITGILFDSLHDSAYFRKFYARRALRIFPLYYGVLLVCFALTPWLGTEWGSKKWALLLYLQNTNIAGPFYAFAVSPGVSIDHFWSLAVEEQFYFMWPFVVFFIRNRKRLLWVCLSLSCVAICLRFLLATHNAVYHTINRNTFCRMDSLLIGAALTLLIRSDFRSVVLDSAKKSFFGIVAIVSLLNVAGLLVSRNPNYRFAFDAGYLSVRYTLMALGSAALIAWCLEPSSCACRVFENLGLRFLGKYSYGLYVLHFVALYFLIGTFRNWIGVLTPNKGIQVVGAGCISFVIAVIAAYASYNLYEKRFLRLKRYFDYDRPVQIAEREMAVSGS